MTHDLTTSIARCWQIIRVDGAKFSYTDHNKNLQIEDDVYSSAHPLQMSAVEQNIGLDADNLEVSGFFEDGNISKADIENGLFDEANFRCFEYDWKNGLVGRELFFGVFSSQSYAGHGFNIETQAPFGKLERVFGRGYHKTCDVELGDLKCGLDLDQIGYVYSPDIIALYDFTIEIENVEAVAIGRFQYGTVELFIGDKQVGKHSIRTDKIDDTTRKIECWKRFVGDEILADRLLISVGCDKTIECCASRFNNAANFRGFPNIPNDDWIAVKDSS